MADACGVGPAGDCAGDGHACACDEFAAIDHCALLAGRAYGGFDSSSRHLKIIRGGIFLRKMPLGVYVSVKSRIETAVGLPRATD